MRRLGHSGKVDSNHAAVRDYLRERGWDVHSTASLGHGFPDLLVGRPGFCCLVEVKRDEKEKLTADQVEFRKNWEGPWIVAISGEDAERQLEAL
jgi:Holliday junction resolvase